MAKKGTKKAAPKRRYTSPKFKSKANKNSDRSKKKLRALLPEYNLKTRFDLLEMDAQYLKDLKNNPEAAEWLNKFNTEFVNASFNRHKNHLHRTKAAKRDCYTKNNARNRCIYTREKAQGKLDSYEQILELKKLQEENYENNYLDELFKEKLNDLEDGSDESNGSSET